MATKAELISNIQAQLTLNPQKTSRSEHESFLFGTQDSVLETVYASSITETHTSNSITVPVDANFQYEVEISKVGRAVVVLLNVVNVSGGFLSGTPFKITSTSGAQYLGLPSQTVNYQVYDSNGDNVRVTLTNSATETNFVINTIPNSTSFKGTIIYNAKD